MTEKPLLLVDIDGVVSLFDFDPRAIPAGQFAIVDGVAHLISATAGEHLLALSADFELVWCSGWEEKANEYLPHLLGLPGPLPFLTFSAGPPSERGHWKLEAIDRHVRARPLAWIDDAFNEAAHRWARERPAPTLLVRTAPARGLALDHVQALAAWARELTGPER